MGATRWRRTTVAGFRVEQVSLPPGSSGREDPMACCCFRLQGAAGPRIGTLLHVPRCGSAGWRDDLARRAVADRPTQQRAGAPSGAPGLLLLPRSRSLPCAPGRRPERQRPSDAAGYRSERESACRDLVLARCETDVIHGAETCIRVGACTRIKRARRGSLCPEAAAWLPSRVRLVAPFLGGGAALRISPGATRSG